MSLETEVAALTQATTNLLGAVNVSKATLDQRVADAAAETTKSTTKAAEASASAAAANTKAGESAGSAAQSLAIYGSTAAQQAAVTAAQNAASVAAGHAASASSVVQQDLSGVTATALHRSPNAVTAMFVYDTGKDSDGGAWTEKCQHTSWYNEAINGKWLGAQASEAAARAVSGATTGDYFQLTTDGKFYRLNATSGVTEVFRGNKRDFPRLSAIVADGGAGTFGLTVYDLTEPGRPMWMRFTSRNLASELAILDATWSSPSGASSIAAVNGSVVVGSANNQYYGGTRELEFPKDRAIVRWWQGYGQCQSYFGLAKRNWPDVVPNSGGYTNHTGIVDGRVNAVAMTVLPDAPVDPVTGLKVPTIAVATGGGVSLLRHTGVVENKAFHSANCWQVSFKDRLLLVMGIGPSAWNGSWTWDMVDGTVTDYGTTSPVRLNDNIGGESRGIAAGGVLLGGQHTRGVTQVKYHKGNVTRALGARIASNFNTGHLPGDIRRAYLADNTVGSVGGPELVTNGTFDVDTAGWTAAQCAITSLSGVGRVTASAAFPVTSSPVSLVVGKTYRFSVNITAIAASRQVFFGIGNSPLITEGNNAGTQTAAPGVLSFIYTPTQNPTQHINLIGLNSYSPNETFDFDNVSVREVIQDRSYKAASAPITGTLTKTEVASAAQLVAFSGFSAANYLQEPYSADLDFGVGEWSVSAWVNTPVHPQFYQNLVSYSNDFVLGWGQDGLTVTAGYETAGGLVYARIEQPAVSTGANRIWKSSPATIHANSNTSIYVRRIAGSTDRLLLAFHGGWGTGPGFSAYYDPVTQAFYGTGSSSFVVQAIDADTARISLASLKNGSGSSTYWSLQVQNTSGTLFGAGTGGVAVAGFQLTIGAALQPYEATGATVTSRVHPAAARAHSSGPEVSFGVNSAGFVAATAHDGTTTRTVTTTAAYNTATWLKARVNYTTDGTLAILVNGVQVAATRGNPLLTLNSRYNLLTYTEDFSNAAWGKSGVAVVTPNYAVAPDATMTATRVQIPTGSAFSSVVHQDSLPNLPNSSPTFGMWAWMASGTGKITLGVTQLGVLDHYSAYIDLTTTPTWISFTANFGGGGSGTAVKIINGADGVGVDFLCWHPQVVVGPARPYQRVGAATDFDFAAPLTIGNSYALDAPFPGSLALLKLGATVPTPEQSLWMYEQEKHLFQAGAQCCLPDAGAIADLTYDEATDKWIAISATNESEWSGLVRTSVTAVPAGSYTRAVAGGGVQLLARSTTTPGVDVTIPAYGLREELVKRAEAAARLNAQTALYDFVGGFTANTTSGNTAILSITNLTYPTRIQGARVTGTGIPANASIADVSGTTGYLSATATATGTAVQINLLDFALPTGLTATAVSVNGVVQREGPTAAYTRLFDGFREVIRFAVAPGNTAWVQIQTVRSVT